MSFIAVLHKEEIVKEDLFIVPHYTVYLVKQFSSILVMLSHIHFYFWVTHKLMIYCIGS
jgi:hypothetical protein